MSNQLPEIRTDEDKIIETLIIEGNDSLYEDLVRCGNKNLSVHSYYSKFLHTNYLFKYKVFIFILYRFYL